MSNEINKIAANFQNIKGAETDPTLKAGFEEIKAVLGIGASGKAPGPQTASSNSVLGIESILSDLEKANAA